MEYKQKSLEHFFEQYQITDADKKATLLPLITDLIYDRNMHVVKLEKEKDEYKRNQIISGIQELEAVIDRNFKS